MAMNPKPGKDWRYHERSNVEGTTICKSTRPRVYVLIIGFRFLGNHVREVSKRYSVLLGVRQENCWSRLKLIPVNSVLQPLPAHNHYLESTSVWKKEVFGIVGGLAAFAAVWSVYKALSVASQP
ncbi:hypothetical protein BDD12DRAFT_807970 [Trichophaea hybrida]|nr:hypothetical protein BDD12DRAFT_807970 [Trichophaea hybrida]